MLISSLNCPARIARARQNTKLNICHSAVLRWLQRIFNPARHHYENADNHQLRTVQAGGPVKIQVRCENCGWVDEKDVKFLDIEEDFEGKDVETFECHLCKTEQKSRRYG
jgi:hypothetical protein